MTTNTPTGREPVFVMRAASGRDIVFERESSGTYYHKGTPPRLRGVLESAREQGARVRLFYGDTDGNDLGRQWLDDCDVTGRLTRSMGPIKVPIILANRRSSGGHAILDDCVIRVMVDGREAYRHPAYQTPELWIAPEATPNPRWPVAVWCNKRGLATVVARFANEARAARWIAFMRGERMAP